MKSLFIIVVSYILMLQGLSRAATPPSPGLSYLYTGNVTLAEPKNIGLGPWGTRILFPVDHGVFSGPELKGAIVPVGGDWTLVSDNGTITVDVRQTLQTDDGAYIQVSETGTSQSDGTVHIRLTYETGTEKYQWLNSVVAVGIINILSSNELSIDVWQLVPSDSSSVQHCSSA